MEHPYYESAIYDCLSLLIHVVGLLLLDFLLITGIALHLKKSAKWLFKKWIIVNLIGLPALAICKIVLHFPR